MTRAQKQQAAWWLRRLPNRPRLEDIGALFDVSKTTILRWTNDDSASRDRAQSRDWKARNPERRREYDRQRNLDKRGTCRRCDKPMGLGVTHDGVCTACRHASVHERRLLIVTWWAQGRKLDEIARDLHWTIGQLSSEMDRMRAVGYHLPYRRIQANHRYAA